MSPLQRFAVVAIWLLGLSHSARIDAAENVVTLAAGERPPYIGATLAQNGYVFELVEEAFKRKGYRLHVNFYPWSRAKRLAAQGAVDGVVPVYADASTGSSEFVYSAPFPGDTIGLLKKKSTQVPYPSEPSRNQDALFKSLSNYRFGALRDGETLPSFDAATFLPKELSDGLCGHN